MRTEISKLIAQVPHQKPTSRRRKVLDSLASRFAQSLSLLTQKEREVLSSFVELLDNKEIARTLGTKDQTVRNQLASIMRKLDLQSREELIAFILIHALCP